MRNTIAFFIFCICAVACKDPAKVKAYEKKQQQLNDTLGVVRQPIFENITFDQQLLVGKWRLDIDELKEEITRNAASKQEADTVMHEIDRYRSLRFKFNEDETFEGYLDNLQTMEGSWGMSGDSTSYWIRLADDFIELHEIKALTKDKLVEFPVASMKVAQMPVKQIVFLRVK